jgi:hypothetical protein
MDKIDDARKSVDEAIALVGKDVTDWVCLPNLIYLHATLH